MRIYVGPIYSNVKLADSKKFLQFSLDVIIVLLTNTFEYKWCDLCSFTAAINITKIAM